MIYFTITKKNLIDNSVNEFSCEFEILNIVDVEKQKTCGKYQKAYVELQVKFTDCNRFGEDWNRVIANFDVTDDVADIILSNENPIGKKFNFVMRILTSSGKKIPHYSLSHFVGEEKLDFIPKTKTIKPKKEHKKMKVQVEDTVDSVKEALKRRLIEIREGKSNEFENVEEWLLHLASIDDFDDFSKEVQKYVSQFIKKVQRDENRLSV